MQSSSDYISANKKDWDVNLLALLFGIRVAPSPTTGESSFYLLYGCEPVLPLELPLKPPNKVPISIDQFIIVSLLIRLQKSRFNFHSKA